MRSKMDVIPFFFFFKNILYNTLKCKGEDF